MRFPSPAIVNPRVIQAIRSGALGKIGAAKTRRAANTRRRMTMSEPESVTALAEFKVACDHWLPLLNECDQGKASTHVNSMFEKLRNSRGSPGQAA
jgi:hypothetical protein